MPGDSKNTKDSILFEYFSAFLTQDKLKDVEKLFKEGSGWGELKKMLFEIINEELIPLREKYEELVSKPDTIEEILIAGEKQAIIQAENKIKEVREKVGIKPLHG